MATPVTTATFDAPFELELEPLAADGADRAAEADGLLRAADDLLLAADDLLLVAPLPPLLFEEALRALLVEERVFAWAIAPP